MSQICGMLKYPGNYMEVFQVKFVGHFSSISVSRYRRALMSLDVGSLWRWREELKAVHKGPASLRPRCYTTTPVNSQPQGHSGAGRIMSMKNSKETIGMLIKVQHDAAVCRHLFSVTLLYMFRVSCTHHQEY